MTRFLRGRASPRLGKVVPPIGPLTWALNALPARAADALYSLAGRQEATRPDALADADLDDFARWVAAAYGAARLRFA